MRILLGGYMQAGSTAEHRLRAFRRLPATEVDAFNYMSHLSTRIPFLRKVGEHFLFSPRIADLNRALLERVGKTRPDYVWLDKPVFFYRSTIANLQQNGIKTIAYMPDDPYGPRGDGVWRHFKAALPHYWAHLVPRKVTSAEFIQRGAKRVACVPFAFEPTVHFPPDSAGVIAKDFDVSFVGSPHDERAEWIVKLVRESPGLRFGLFGQGWGRYQASLRSAGLRCMPPVWNDQYRDVVWRSRLSLAFVTRSNRDELSHKAIEIAACGTPVVLEPSPVHDRIFRHRESAYFFQDPHHLTGIIREALGNERELAGVGAGAAAAVRDARMSNDDILMRALNEFGHLSAA